jgi:hypothetical protein
MKLSASASSCHNVIAEENISAHLCSKVKIGWNILCKQKTQESWLVQMRRLQPRSNYVPAVLNKAQRKYSYGFAQRILN